jgi:hypothetical protein
MTMNDMTTMTQFNDLNFAKGRRRPRGGGSPMKSARVSTLLFLIFAVVTAASVSSGYVWATPGSCESLPGGVIELVS